MLVKKLEERGWFIWNGATLGDEKDEFTFTGGKGNTVIDYVIGDDEARDRVLKMKIGDKIDSDHPPLKIWMKGEVKRKKKKINEQTASKIV